MSRAFSELTALVVDDSRAVRQIFSEILRHFGLWRIHVAADGSEALEIIDRREVEFDLIFCDLNMPGMDGIQAIQEFASRKLHSRIVILSSLEASLMRTVSDLARRLGLNVGGILGKPASLAAVESVLVQAVDDQLATSCSFNEPLSQTELTQALDEDRIVVHYQPKIGLERGSVVGVEALARIRDPERGLLAPATFIQAAESDSELMSRLTQAVLRDSLAQSAEWRRSGLKLDLAFNLSTLGIRDRELPNLLKTMVTELKLPPDSVIAEITETRALDSVMLLDTVSRLRMMGFRLAIDDYGTGESGLTRLCEMPFTQIKIDRRFVHGSAGVQRAEAVLKSTIEMGTQMNLEVVAEGVEQMGDWKLLAGLGCGQIQGFLASRPVPAEQIPGFVKMWAEES